MKWLPSSKHFWISQETIELIEQRGKAMQDFDTERANQLQEEIKKAARKDKKKWTSEKLQEGEAQPMNSKERWAWVKMTRNGSGTGQSPSTGTTARQYRPRSRRRSSRTTFR